ncbi:bifunctional indole-3-glycerol-phosphate synthase TrpC/phosphoribosylanthranilate isomerase TrpF [Vibrio sp. WJH972]
MTQQLSEHISTLHTEMAEVLVKIVKDKAIWVEERKQQQPLANFESEITLSDRSFYQALTSEHAVFILECKKASPSKGLIRPIFNPEEIATAYKPYANAISVLTDEKYFQGSFDFLPQVRNSVHQPVLCKDFMIDPYQVYLARHYGADAILLMLSVLDDNEYRELAELAHRFKMGVLTEVSNDEELVRAVNLDAKVIGINNRNLRDLTTDLNRTKELAPKLPQDRIIISESGIYTHQQVRDLATHANGFLIGSSLMAQDNIDRAARRMILGDNKVCGLTRAEDAQAVHQAGSVYGGLIFVEKSPRYVTPEQASQVIEGAPLLYVGVFQNHDLSDIVTIASQLSLNAVQLHGTEDQDYVSRLRKQLPESIAIWKAYGVSDEMPAKLGADIERHLFDAKVGEQLGGTGTTFDWRALTDTSDIMLAGGINPNNAQQAASLGCLGLDLNSGVESSPGQKDNEKLEQAFAKIRAY